MNCQQEFDAILRTLKKRRVELGISQESAGKKIGVNQSQFSKKENGTQEFTLYEFLLLCDLLNLKILNSDPG